MLKNILYTGFWYQCNCDRPIFISFKKFNSLTSDNQTNEKAIHCTGCKKIHRGQDVLEKVETGYAGVGTAFKCSECDYTNVKLCESKSKEVNNVKVEFALVETASCSKCKTEFAVKVIKDEVAGFKNILIKK